MLLQGSLTRSSRGPIRPFNPARDMNALADLIQVCFGHELVVTNSRIVRDLRQLSVAGPLVWAVNNVTPVFGGFVWIENDRLVGNASVFRAHAPKAWTIANVAVLPEYRGRGIASQLVDASLDHLRNMGARQALLQVRADNPSAQAIYLRRGFSVYDQVVEMFYPRGPWPLVLGPRSQRLRRVHARDGRSLHRLAVACMPDAAQRVRPLDSAEFRRGIGWQIARFFREGLSNRHSVELVGDSGGQIVAHFEASVRMIQGPHEVRFRVHPSQRGLWEKDLAEAAIVALTETPRLGCKATVASQHVSQVNALRALGFEPLRTLDQMVLEFN